MKRLMLLSAFLFACSPAVRPAVVDASPPCTITQPPQPSPAALEWIIGARDVGNGQLLLLVDLKGFGEFQAWYDLNEKWAEDTWNSCGDGTPLAKTPTTSTEDAGNDDSSH